MKNRERNDSSNKRMNTNIYLKTNKQVKISGKKILISDREIVREFNKYSMKAADELLRCIYSSNG